VAKREANQATPWRSRILGHGEEDPTQLLANPGNWRTHPARQRAALRGALSSVGWVQSVIVNQTTGHLVDGHARVEEAISRGEPSVPVVYVELSAEEEAVVLASLDPIGAMATADMQRLGELLAGVTVDDAGLADLLKRIAPPEQNAYTTAVVTPVYQPTGARPAVSELRDETRADQLRAEIMEAELEPDVREFLLAAAGRHTVFTYSRIAEFYAHAEAEVQRLMERSALVIVDVDNAIRDGFVRVQGELEQYADEDAAENV